ncbi:MAG: DNA-protecting protein DprA [Propionibacteriaceae bacterium]|nr:DNA-protecting protein DprA [Propionibacteriaceae bacterium]
MNEWDDERLARLAINRVVEAGTPQAASLVAQYGALEAWSRIKVWNGEERVWALRAARINVEALVEEADESGMRFIIPGDDEWPDGLASLEFCGEPDGRGGVPIGLWLRGPGNLTEMTRRCVAIVGSRASTRYGEIVATELANDLTMQQPSVTVISGGAYGIDACAHRGALTGEGHTIGVFAQGLDNAYPRGNSSLFERLATEQLVVSEAPPGFPPSKMAFLCRNRLIAALSQATVIVEAAARSGARNTASWATALSRVLLAVPGPVTAATSVTPNRLIRDAEAGLVSSVEDVLMAVGELNGYGQEPLFTAKSQWDELTDAQRLLLEALPPRGWRTQGELSLVSGLPMSKCLAAISELDALGLLVSGSSGWRLAAGGSQQLREAA